MIRSNGIWLSDEEVNAMLPENNSDFEECDDAEHKGSDIKLRSALNLTLYPANH